MTQQALEERVGKVEIVQARHGERLEHIEGELGRANKGIDKLLDREERRPAPMTWQAVAATCVGLAAVAVVGWWLIGTSPAVQDLDKRLSRLDDPEFGRVPRVERKVQELDQWRPSVTKY